MRLPRVSLLAKILLSTSVAITLLFGITGWLVQRQTAQATAKMLHDEVEVSFRVSEALWKSREKTLASLSRILSSMSDVRAAFSTGDPATIKDTAVELWSRIDDSDGVFLVTDPDGQIISSTGSASSGITGTLPFVQSVRSSFPEQRSGFVFLNSRLYQVTVTPVYVQSGSNTGLINVVVAGYQVGPELASQLKGATGGSEFLFRAGKRVLASTLNAASERDFRLAVLSGTEPKDYALFRTELRDLSEVPVAELWILRPFASAAAQMAALNRSIFYTYVVVLTAGLFITSVLAKRILEPIRELGKAASEVSRQNYDYRLEVRSHDEIGKLAQTFNSMSASLVRAREELIQHERLSTIGNLSTSIIHDLRNPLAAIYGGAEMLVDGDLPAAQVQRLSRNIYRASRSILDLLQQLADASRGAADRTEVCNLSDVVEAAVDPMRAFAETANVRIQVDIPSDIEVPLARARMERVFSNLIVNAVEAMKEGGSISIQGRPVPGAVELEIRDTGPGVPAQIRKRLFQPFTSAGKKNGLGLGLALSRQSVLNQGGDLWLEHASEQGAHFRMRLAL